MDRGEIAADRQLLQHQPQGAHAVSARALVDFTALLLDVDVKRHIQLDRALVDRSDVFNSRRPDAVTRQRRGLCGRIEHSSQSHEMQQ